MTKSTETGRDPIQESPLRDPGQSLREQLWDRVFDRMLFWIIATVMAVTFAAMEWLRWLVGVQFTPVPMTLLAIALGMVGIWKGIALRKELQQLKLGLRGERAVGQFLQGALLPLGYYVFHDICIRDFNIDHAVIGPGGVFAIEVKTRSKPKRGGGRISYDGTQVLVDGFPPDRDPVVQARAVANSLQKILEQRTGRTAPVRSVVLFPGWWVDRQPSGVETWVLNEKAFVKFIEREPKVFDVAEVRVLTEGLARYVREQVDG